MSLSDGSVFSLEEPPEFKRVSWAAPGQMPNANGAWWLDPEAGEVGPAHHGVLFLDELPEFECEVREVTPRGARQRQRRKPQHGALNNRVSLRHWLPGGSAAAEVPPGPATILSTGVAGSTSPVASGPLRRR